MLNVTEKEAAAMGIPIPPKPKKKSKYSAKKITLDGIKFDSQLEANFYAELKLLQRGGIITGFARQASFPINTEGSRYVCDFVVFFPNGKYKIIDTKGMKTEVFKLKMKCFREKFPQLTVYDQNSNPL